MRPLPRAFCYRPCAGTARLRSGLDPLLAVLRHPVGCGRRKDAVIDRTGLANEASPFQLGFRDESDDVAHVLFSSRGS
ncbi:hypothetical protein CT676_01010 [Bradyrhizobium sp. MOS001]|nr:hypothetical protein CT676_01010 [Bradyrhizobium sp. MOS001]